MDLSEEQLQMWEMFQFVLDTRDRLGGTRVAHTYVGDVLVALYLAPRKSLHEYAEVYCFMPGGEVTWGHGVLVEEALDDLVSGLSTWFGEDMEWHDERT